MYLCILNRDTQHHYARSCHMGTTDSIFEHAVVNTKEEAINFMVSSLINDDFDQILIYDQNFKQVWFDEIDQQVAAQKAIMQKKVLEEADRERKNYLQRVENEERLKYEVLKRKYETSN